MDTQTKLFTRKDARVQIRKALASLVMLQTEIGEKKFNKRVSKVEKILSEGIPKGKKKKAQTPSLERIA